MLDESDFITVAGIISLRGGGGREASHMVVIVVISVQDSLFVCPFTSPLWKLPGSYTCRDCTDGLPCPLASSWVQLVMVPRGNWRREEGQAEILSL